MVSFLKSVTIDFAELAGEEVGGWLEAIGKARGDLPDLECDVDVNVELSEFTDDSIREEFERRFADDEDAIQRAYRLMAEGDRDGAMQELADAFTHLRPPYAEQRLAATIARGRQGVLNV